MANIVERLRMDADPSNPYCLTVDDIFDAANEIESLRQRVAELEENLSTALKESQKYYDELAALKGG